MVLPLIELHVLPPLNRDRGCWSLEGALMLLLYEAAQTLFFLVPPQFEVVVA